MTLAIHQFDVRTGMSECGLDHGRRHHGLAFAGDFGRCDETAVAIDEGEPAIQRIDRVELLKIGEDFRVVWPDEKG
jgi:hypothetical protein